MTTVTKNFDSLKIWPLSYNAGCFFPYFQEVGLESCVTNVT